MSTEQTSNFWYLMLSLHWEPPAALWTVWQSRSGSDITALTTVENAELRFWPPGCQRGPKSGGQNGPVLLWTAGFGTVTHCAHPPVSHRHQSNPGCYPDDLLFSSSEGFLSLCDNLGSVFTLGGWWSDVPSLCFRTAEETAFREEHGWHWHFLETEINLLCCYEKPLQRLWKHSFKIFSLYMKFFLTTPTLSALCQFYINIFV